MQLVTIILWYSLSSTFDILFFFFFRLFVFCFVCLFFNSPQIANLLDNGWVFGNSSNYGLPSLSFFFSAVKFSFSNFPPPPLQAVEAILFFFVGYSLHGALSSRNLPFQNLSSRSKQVKKGIFLQKSFYFYFYFRKIHLTFLFCIYYILYLQIVFVSTLVTFIFLFWVVILGYAVYDIFASKKISFLSFSFFFFLFLSFLLSPKPYQINSRR